MQRSRILIVRRRLWLMYSIIGEASARFRRFHRVVRSRFNVRSMVVHNHMLRNLFAIGSLIISIMSIGCDSQPSGQLGSERWRILKRKKKQMVKNCDARLMPATTNTYKANCASCLHGLNGFSSLVTQE